MNRLPPSLHWFQGLLLICGAFFVSVYQTGWALSEIGSWSLLVWGAVVLVGLLQAWLLYRLARAFPHKAGGTATYALELFRGRGRVLAFLSGWGYWVAWTPATVLNSYLCASLLESVLGTALEPVPLALGILALLYALNWFGLSRVVVSSYVLALLVFVPLGVLVWLAFQSVTPEKLALTLDFAQAPGWLSLLKWFFVIAWTGYGLEMISSVVAETQGHRARPMFAWASLWSVLAFVGIPLLLALLTDWDTLSSDPFASLRPLFVRHLGEGGALILTLFLVAALLYSALAILVPSTRTVYQMSRDGLLPPYFATVNRYGTPQGSLVLDLLLNVGLLLAFQARLVEILAVANVGYMLVFVLLPVAYALHERRSGRRAGGLERALVAFLFVLNAAVLLLGGAAWGPFVFGAGWLLVLAGVPLYFLSLRWAGAARSSA